MSTVVCPSCGEEERLRGERHGDDIHVFCEACSARWIRDLRKRCGNCRSENLRFTPIPLWGRGRGTMQTPTGQRDAWTCDDCGASDATRKKQP